MLAGRRLGHRREDVIGRQIATRFTAPAAVDGRPAATIN
jgi:hypothetical protein